MEIDSNRENTNYIPGLRLAWRFALRELRGGMKGFYIFLACIALGVGAIASVGSRNRINTTDGIKATFATGVDPIFSPLTKVFDSVRGAHYIREPYAELIPNHDRFSPGNQP